MSEEYGLEIKHTKVNKNYKNVGRTDKLIYEKRKNWLRKLESIHVSKAKHWNIIRTGEKWPMHGKVLMSSLNLRIVIIYVMSK